MKEPIPVQPGRLAVSRAGRDKGRCFLVIKEEPPFVFVADGALRKLEKPKKKKRMHLCIKPMMDPDIGKRLTCGEFVTNHDIREAIKAFGFCVK